MASSSLVQPSLLSKTLIFSKTSNPTALFFFSPTLSLKTPLKPLSLKYQQTLSSRFVRNVAISSEFDQEEDEEVDSGDVANFSPDLKLFVGNLPFNVDSSELAGLFEKAGNVEMVEVIYDKVTGRSRGFGFVTMSSVQEVQEAQDLFNGYDLNGRLLRVNSGPPPPKDDSFSRGPRGGGGYDSPRGGSFGGSGRSFDNTNRVYVGNLSWGVDDAALENLFSEQGKVVEAKVVYDRESGRSRGFGFVTYNSADEVNSAISSLDGADLNGRSIRVTVAEAKPRRQF